MPRFVLAAVVLLWATAVHAAGLVPAHVDADAKWFGHFNCEAIRALPIVEQMKQKCPKCWDKGDALKAKIGVNPMKDLLGLTVYSTQYEGEKGVGIFYVKGLDAGKLVEAFKKKHPDHHVAKHGERTLYTWTAKHKHHQMKLSGTVVDNKLVVIGADIDHVRAALDVIDGKRDALKPGASLLAGIPKKPLFASKAIDVPEKYRHDTKCPVLKNCTEALAVWTGNKEHIRARYHFTTVAPEDARNFADLVAGFKAMVSLRMGEVEAVQKVLKGLKVKAKDTEFRLNWKMPVEDLHAAMKEAIERKLHHKAKSKHYESAEKADKKCPKKKEGAKPKEKQ